MNKRIWSVLVSAVLLWTVLTPWARAATGYSDVPSGAWYAGAAVWCRTEGLLQGVRPDTFAPRVPLSRAMIVTALHRLSGRPAPERVAGFSDVSGDAWYGAAVNWAAGARIVTGYDDGGFHPDASVSRGELVTLLWRHAGQPESRPVKAFADVDEMASWARDAVDWAVSTGITRGVGGNRFAPRSGATRAEAAVMLMSYARGSGVVYAPSGLAVTGEGALLVADTCNKVLWKAEPESSTVYAGGMTVLNLYGEPVGGYADGEEEESMFGEPWGVAPYRDGWAVTDASNGVIRLLESGTVQTLNRVGTKEALRFERPTGLTSDGAGNLYVSETLAGKVWRISGSGAVKELAAGLREPTGLSWHAGTLYIAETGADRIVTLREGEVKVLTGGVGDGCADGALAEAEFCGPQGITVAADGTVYISDTVNGAVRRLRDGRVETILRRDAGVEEQFYPVSPMGLALIEDTLYVSDNFARKVLAVALSE